MPSPTIQINCYTHLLTVMKNPDLYGPFTDECIEDASHWLTNGLYDTACPDLKTALHEICDKGNRSLGMDTRWADELGKAIWNNEFILGKSVLSTHKLDSSMHMIRIAHIDDFCLTSDAFYFWCAQIEIVMQYRVVLLKGEL